MSTIPIDSLNFQQSFHNRSFKLRSPLRFLLSQHIQQFFILYISSSTGFPPSKGHTISYQESTIKYKQNYFQHNHESSAHICSLRMHHKCNSSQKLESSWFSISFNHTSISTHKRTTFKFMLEMKRCVQMHGPENSN